MDDKTENPDRKRANESENPSFFLGMYKLIRNKSMELGEGKLKEIASELGRHCRKFLVVT